MSLLSRFVKEKDALHCLLLPLQGGVYWLIPSVAGAEVLVGAYQRQADDRACTMQPWRGQDIPVLCAEALMGHAVIPNAQGRMVVLHSLQSETEMPFWGLALEQLPQIIRLSHADISLSAEDPLPPHVHAKVALHDEKNVYIPHLESLEAYLFKELTPAE